MTDLALAPDDLDQIEVGTDVAELSDNFVRLMRTFNRARSRMMTEAAHDVEWSSRIVLKVLQNEGPMRAGALAEHLESDPSTVSRQVAALVKDGLLERRADPDDGRASILVLTERAGDVLVEHDRIRLQYFAEMLGNWSAEEIRTFSGLLLRFTDDFVNSDHDRVRARLTASTRSNVPTAPDTATEEALTS